MMVGRKQTSSSLSSSQDGWLGGDSHERQCLNHWFFPVSKFWGFLIGSCSCGMEGER